MHCFDGKDWTQIEWPRDESGKVLYDAPAEVFRGESYHAILVLVASFLATWIEKEFRSSPIVGARHLAQGVLYSETGPLLVLRKQDGWYICRDGSKVVEDMQRRVATWHD